MKARATTSKRRAREKQVPDLPEPVEAVHMDHWDDLLPLLDQELHRLPERYRITSSSYATWGARPTSRRQRNSAGRSGRSRDDSRGPGRAGQAVDPAWRHGSLAACRPCCWRKDRHRPARRLPLVTSTTRAATKIAAGQAAADVVSARVAALTEGVLKAMLMTKFKIATHDADGDGPGGGWHAVVRPGPTGRGGPEDGCRHEADQRRNRSSEEGGCRGPAPRP